jgi:hypothetical protein
MVEWYGQGKLLIRRPDLCGKPTLSHLLAKQGDLAKETMNFALRSIFVDT